jgi:catechol 2,3-dioxygenase-like lactoylglutathione lyase family enzyme
VILRLDHLVLTVADLEATVRFYRDGLGMTPRTFGEGRHALHFGAQKINLHLSGHEFEPKAGRPTPGSADLCFLIEEPLEEVAARLTALDHPVLLGPVPRAGGCGPILSIYVRDPDGNLIELARPA